MYKTSSKCLLRRSAWCEDIIDNLQQMSTRPNSTIQRITPIREWYYEPSFSPNSSLMSTSGRYLLDRGFSALAGSFCPFSPMYSSTLLTVALTYWVDPNAQHFWLLAILTWRSFPPRYYNGGPIDSSLSFKCFPISSLRIASGLCKITRQSST